MQKLNHSSQIPSSPFLEPKGLIINPFILRGPKQSIEQMPVGL